MENEKLTIKIEDDILECRFEKCGRVITYRENVDVVYERAIRAYRTPEIFDKSWIISKFAESFVRREHRVITTML